LLLREKEEITALAREANVHEWTGKLIDIAHAIYQVDQQLSPERESAGSR
jgi:hypothetical protein